LNEIAKLGPIAFKGYLYPPSDSVKCLPGNLDVVFKELENSPIPLILDVNIPDPRMHYVTSPCHCISL
jgi:hypothetical protein